MPRRIVFCWEWGTGFGHMARFRPLANLLRKDGHEVVVIVRDLTKATRFFPASDYSLFQAPVLPPAGVNRLIDPRTLSGLAWNLGYNNEQAVHSVVAAWFNLLSGLKPDLVVSDFGIGASIASMFQKCNHCRIGTGFECPPSIHPLAPLRLQTPPQDVDREHELDATICRWINSSDCARHYKTSVNWMAELIGASDSFLLSTFPEFDHYSRSLGLDNYLGVWDQVDGGPIQWNGADGPKAFAYLKPHPNARRLLSDIAARGINIAVATNSDQIDSIIPADANGIHPQVDLVSLDDVADSCAFAVTNANHGTTMKLIAKGVPILAAPLFIEQRVTASRLEVLGLGRQLASGSHDSLNQVLDSILELRDSETLLDFSRQCVQQVGKVSLERAYQRIQQLI